MANTLRKLKEQYYNTALVVKASFWFLVCSILQKGISLITTPIFTRLLTTEEYGVFSVYNSWFQIVLLFVTLRLDGGVFNKGMSKFRDEKNEYTASMQGITTCICIFCGIFFLFFYKSIGLLTELTVDLLGLMLLHLFFTPAISFWTLRQRYDYKYRSVVTVTLLLSFFNCVVGLICVFSSQNRGVGRIFSIVLVHCICGIGIYINNFLKGKCFIKKAHAKFALVFSLPLIPHYLSMYILNSSDRIMIQKICGTADVALYSVVYNISMILQFIVDSLNSSLAPWLYKKLEEGDTQYLEKIILTLAVWIFAFLALFMLVAPEVIYILAGEKYMDAVRIVPCITSSILCIFIYQLVGNIEFFYDANKFTVFVSFGGAILNIVLNYFAIPVFGYVAAGYTTLTCYIVFVFAHTLYAKKLSNKIDGITIISPFKVSWLCTVLVVYSAIMILLYDYIIIRYVFILGILCIAALNYKKILYVLKPLSKKDR